MRQHYLVVLVSGILLAACAAPSGPVATVVPPTAPAGPTSAPAGPTRAQAFLTPTMASTTPVPQSLPPLTPKQALLRLLELVGLELRAMQTSASLAEARQHAEAVVNISVGTFGRWYGDGDHDGKALDPSDGSGILPGERVPGPPPDVGTPAFPYGWALQAFDNGNNTDQEVIASLLGNVDTWRSSARAGYDEIQASVAGSDPQRISIVKLTGSVPRMVAYARLILTKVQTLDQARTYAGLALPESSAALAAARRINP